MKNFIYSAIVFIYSISIYAETFSGKVVSVHDGDTVRILVENKQVKVRLFGIDAPETNQAFGTKSKEALKSLVHKKQVTVDHKGKDQFGRTLGVIFLEGKDINLEMLKLGMVWVYKIHRKKGPYLSAEEEAKKNSIGLWADKDPTPPWIFRKK
ncbi:MAG: thermonuclease family protein [Leptospiraceae bacterium]|nr:thermonuclease family protein [Leptospiraceae bacterium]